MVRGCSANLLQIRWGLFRICGFTGGPSPCASQSGNHAYSHRGISGVCAQPLGVWRSLQNMRKHHLGQTHYGVAPSGNDLFVSPRQGHCMMISSNLHPFSKKFNTFMQCVYCTPENGHKTGQIVDPQEVTPLYFSRNLFAMQGLFDKVAENFAGFLLRSL